MSKSGWYNEKHRHRITSYGSKQRKALTVRGFHSGGGDIGGFKINKSMNASEILNEMNKVMGRIDELQSKSKLTIEEEKELESLYALRFEIYKYLGLSDYEREKYTSMMRAIVNQYNRDTSASIQGVEFFNAFTGMPIINNNKLSGVMIRLPYRNKDGDYIFKQSHVPLTAFNYVMDEKFENELESLMTDSTLFNSLKDIKETHEDIFNGMKEILDYIASSFEDSTEISDNAMKVKNIMDIVEEGKGLDSIVDINKILTERPATQIMVFEPIILLGMNDEERELLAKGVLLHEIGHSLFTFDYTPIRPTKLKLIESKGYSKLVNAFMNILEDGRLTRKLIKSSHIWSYKTISKSLMLLAYRFHQNVIGKNPIKSILDNTNNPMDIGTDPLIAMNIMTLSAHFNMGIDKKILYNYFYKVLDEGFDKTDKNKIDKIIAKYLQEHPNDKKLNRRDLLKKAREWYINEMITSLPLWRFLYEKDVNGDTGYDLIEKAFESKSTLEEYDYVSKLLHRYLVVYDFAEQKPKNGGQGNEGQEGSSGSKGQQGKTGQPGEGSGEKNGESGEGKQSGSDNEGGKEPSMKGEAEDEEFPGKSSPINPNADLEIKSSPDIGDTGTMPDMGNDKDGSTIGMGSGGDIDVSDVSDMPDDSTDAKTDDDKITSAQKDATEIGNKAKGSKTHEDAKDELADELDNSASENGMGDESLADITEEFDNETPSGKKTKSSRSNGKPQKGKQKASGRETYDNMKDDIKLRINERRKILEHEKYRLPMSNEVFSNTDKTLYIPTDDKVIRYATSFMKTLMKDIEKETTEILSSPQRRGSKIISTKLSQVITSPRTARPFQKTIEVKQLLPPMNIYVLVDNSGSIPKGLLEEEIRVLKGMSLGLQKVKKKVGSNTYPINFVPIAFGVSANYHGEYTDVIGVDTVGDYYPDSSGATPTGKALSFIADSRKKTEIIREFNGRVRAGATDVVIILTDGAPTDSYEQYVKKIENNKGIIIPIYIGGKMPTGFKSTFSRKDTIIENVSYEDLPDITRNIFKTIVNKEIKQNLRRVM